MELPEKIGKPGEMKQKIHNFKERLDYSEKAGHELFWNAVYQKAFPDMEFHKLCTSNCNGQRLGVDRVVYLKSGKTLYIDEKKREKTWDDILIEYISVDTEQTPGWIEKPLLIDYLAYAFMPTQKCYLFPWQLLQRSWKHFKSCWLGKYPTITARNDNYNTLSVAVPIDVLLKTLTTSMIIQL